MTRQYKTQAASPDLACATAHGARAHVAAAHGAASRAVTTVGPGRLVHEARSHHPRLERVGKHIGRDVPEGAWIASVQHGFGLLADRRRHCLRQSIGQSGGEKWSQSGTGTVQTVTGPARPNIILVISDDQDGNRVRQDYADFLPTHR